RVRLRVSLQKNVGEKGHPATRRWHTRGRKREANQYAARGTRSDPTKNKIRLGVKSVVASAANINCPPRQASLPYLSRGKSHSSWGGGLSLAIPPQCKGPFLPTPEKQR